MTHINDIFSSSNPESEENIETIIEVAASRILKDYKDARKPVPSITYPSFSPELDRSHPYVDLIVDGIHTSLEKVFSPEAGSYITPDILRRIFEGVFIKLKLHPIRVRDKKGNNTVYRSDSVLYEVFAEPSDAIEHHNRLKDYLETILWEMNQKLTRYQGDRTDTLEDFFRSRDQRDRENHSAILAQCSIDIRAIKEKMIDFCLKNDLDNPFDFGDVRALPRNTSFDSPKIKDLYKIFCLSSAEKILSKFLPEGTREEESHLFEFALDNSDIPDDDAYSRQMLDIYEKIYERKILMYYYASTQLPHTSGMQRLEVNHAISNLDFEIKACKKSIAYSSPESGGDEISEEQSDIARVRFLHNRVEALIKGYTAADVGHEVVDIFYTISHALKLFIDTATSRLSATIATEALKNQVIDGLKTTLYTTLDHALTGLEDAEEEPIPKMRLILREACNFLYHK